MGGKRLRWGVVLCLIGCLLVSCTRIYTARGFYHRVRKGDTLASIARGSGASLQEVAEINNVQDPSQLKLGQRLYVPTNKRKSYALSRSKKKSKTKKKGASKATSTPKPQTEKIVFDRKRFSWPVNGPVSSNFGMRKRRRHDGIDIRAKKGTSIRAAASGKVVFSGRLRGYGNMLLIKHKDSFFTAYAHNSKNLTKKGKNVKRGAIIARVGNTGRTTGPHLHFEVRKGRKARNPLFFLPKRK